MSEPGNSAEPGGSSAAPRKRATRKRFLSSDVAEQPAGREPDQLRADAPFTGDLPDDLVAIGRIVAPWGIKGEVKLLLETDYPERIVRGRLVIIGGYTKRLESARVTGREAVIRIQGVTTRNDAEALRGQLVAVEERTLPPLPEDTYYFHQIVGLRVEDEAGKTLGAIRDILATGANDVYVVDTPEGELLLPAIEQVVQQVDLPNGRLIARLMPGLEPVPVRKPKRAASPAEEAPDADSDEESADGDSPDE